ncbi:MAG: phage integrase N-terminal SAM-like domain-containing protein [Defluviitaleaceae bacterium]|nr:phage integrase N-terminal SAM-like domain-containing protein [Defluviitaleaceae bacterium]
MTIPSDQSPQNTSPISPLRQLMIEAMLQAGFTEKTRETYLRAVANFHQHINKPLQEVEEYDFVQYCVLLKQNSPAGTYRSRRWGLVFFFSNVLKRDWPSLREHRPNKRAPAKIHSRGLVDGAIDHPDKAQFRRDMELAGLAPRTRQTYLETVGLFFKRTWLSPREVTEAQLEEYLLLLQRFHIGAGTFKNNRFALQFFFSTTLQRDWTLFEKKWPFPAVTTFPTRAITMSA